MISHLTFISDGLTRTSPCSIGARRNFFNQAVFDPRRTIMPESQPRHV